MPRSADRTGLELMLRVCPAVFERCLAGSIPVRKSQNTVNYHHGNQDSLRKLIIL